MTLLIVTIPQAYISVVVLEIKCSLAVLMVLKPFAFVFLAVEEGIDTKALALALHIYAFKNIAVLPCCAALTVRLASLHLPLVFAAVLHLVGTQRNLLSLSR